MTNSPIQQVVILGGGTAGWLAAGYLERALGETLKVTLVESPEVPSVGVGEATVPTFGNTMRFLGFSEEDWMPKCDATWKLGVNHVGWAGAEGYSSYLHPFFEFPEPRHNPVGPGWFRGVGGGFTLAQCWLAARLNSWTDRRFVEFSGPHWGLCRAGKGPLQSDGQASPDLRYAYHLDADLLVQFLRGHLCQRGVRHLSAHVTGVQRRPDGSIEALITDRAGEVSGDLFIDCSGFRSLLLGQELNEPFESIGESLLLDRAIALRCPLPPGQLPPYTTASTASAGWIWEIPLRSRGGYGYTFSSSHQSDEEAAAELLRHLDGRGVEADLQAISLRPGRHRRSWVQNCVAIGLASSFIEPLESTSILLIEYQLATLLDQFPVGREDDARRAEFNRVCASVYDDVRDFIVAQYVLSGRRDSEFWQGVRANTRTPASVSERLERLREGVFRPDSSLASATIFATRNYFSVLDGLGFPFTSASPLLGRMADKEWVMSTLHAARERHDRTVAALVGHREALERLDRRSDTGP